MRWPFFIALWVLAFVFLPAAWVSTAATLWVAWIAYDVRATLDAMNVQVEVKGQCLFRLTVTTVRLLINTPIFGPQQSWVIAAVSHPGRAKASRTEPSVRWLSALAAQAEQGHARGGHAPW